MSNISANSFGFIQGMNAGKKVSAAFDREVSAKLMLSYLASHNGPQETFKAGRLLGLTSDQGSEVVAYLHDAGMIERLNDDQIELSSFGRDAMGVFDVS